MQQQQMSRLAHTHTHTRTHARCRLVLHLFCRTLSCTAFPRGYTEMQCSCTPPQRVPRACRMEMGVRGGPHLSPVRPAPPRPAVRVRALCRRHHAVPPVRRSRLTGSADGASGGTRRSPTEVPRRWVITPSGELRLSSGRARALVVAPVSYAS